ncbi:MAG: ferrochelatase [Myxococcota bacterium]
MMTGILLINLGTPDAPDTASVRRYLREFLSDGRVLDINPIGRAALVNLIIAPFRAPKSAEAYQSIWFDEGSPLMVYSNQLVDALQERVGERAKIALGMRYGSPSIPSAMAQLAGCDRIVVVPLYPHYASATTGTVLEMVYRHAAAMQVVPNLSVVPPFYDHPAYIAALAEISRPHIADDDHVLFSYHGLPVRQLPCQPCDQTTACPAPTGARASCYRAQCYATSRALAAALGLPEDRWTVSFQSRLGRIPWLEPYTDQTLEAMPETRGIHKLAVLCPAFVADNLETLEEIAIQGVEQFTEAGGERLTTVPCLNAEPAWIDALWTMLLETDPTLAHNASTASSNAATSTDSPSSVQATGG